MAYKFRTMFFKHQVCILTCCSYNLCPRRYKEEIRHKAWLTCNYNQDNCILTGIIHGSWCNCSTEESHSLAAEVLVLLKHSTETAQSFYLTRSNKWRQVVERKEVKNCSSVWFSRCVSWSCEAAPAPGEPCCRHTWRLSHLQHLSLSICHHGRLWPLCYIHFGAYCLIPNRNILFVLCVLH